MIFKLERLKEGFFEAFGSYGPVASDLHSGETYEQSGRQSKGTRQTEKKPWASNVNLQ